MLPRVLLGEKELLQSINCTIDLRKERDFEVFTPPPTLKITHLGGEVDGTHQWGSPGAPGEKNAFQWYLFELFMEP